MSTVEVGFLWMRFGEDAVNSARNQVPKRCSHLPINLMNRPEVVFSIGDYVYISFFSHTESEMETHTHTHTHREREKERGVAEGLREGGVIVNKRYPDFIRGSICLLTYRYLSL